jgi:hypothetical protein
MKVGDKVRVVECQAGYSQFVGVTGVLTDTQLPRYTVRFWDDPDIESLWLPEELEAVPEEENPELSIAEKAALWDAFMNCGRIRLLGYSGWGGPKGKDGHVRHVGMEVWAEFPDAPDNTHARQILQDFAEGMLEPPPNAGVHEVE